MGQKVHPTSLRLGVIKTWNSTWFNEREYAKWLHEDIRIRKFIKDRYKDAAISKIQIERAASKIKVYIHTARPGIVIGKRGAGIEQLKNEIQALAAGEVFLRIQEVRKAEVDAQLVAENIATQLERRVAFRRALKKSVEVAMKFGAQGIRLACAGRLGGSEMGRREWYRKGRIPLHTLRADIEFGYATARTTYGAIGVKCWIYKGDVLRERNRAARA